MLGEFVQAHVTAINGHRLRVRREGDDPRAVVELDDTDLDVLGEAGWPPVFVGPVHGQVFFAVADHRSCQVEDLGKLVTLADVLQRAGIIFGGKEVVAVLEPKPFANILETVCIGPADPDRFLGQGDGLPMLLVDGFLGLNPCDLVRHEVFGELGIGVEGEGAEDVHGIGVMDCLMLLKC
jgi:hypothetical protein